MNAILTHAEETILESLSKHVRLLSVGQLGQLVDSDSRAVNRIVGKLIERGFVRLGRASLPVVPEMSRPIYRTNRRCTSDISFESLAWQLTKRGRKELEPTMFISITAKGAKKTGGWVLKPKMAHLFHDLCMSQVFVNYWKSNQNAAESWEPEELIAFDRDFRSPTPDAFITSLKRVIEIGGPSYTAERLRTLHETFAPNFEYELW